MAANYYRFIEGELTGTICRNDWQEPALGDTDVKASRLSYVCLLLCLLPGTLVYSQEISTSDTRPASGPTVPPGFNEMARLNPTGSCLEPQKLPGIGEYEGPLKTTVGMFGRALERGSVFREPSFIPGAMLCSYGAKDKLLVFLQGSIDPMLLLTAGFEAGIDHSSNRDPSFGLGAEGYGKRFAASYADWQSGRFFKGFVYPVIFDEDPRYFRLGQGSTKRRLGHAVGHVFIAHRPDATHMFNYSEWFGTATAVSLSNVYHPGNSWRAGDMAQSAAFLVGTDIGFDLLREFWPDLARKMKLPFRGLTTKPVSNNSPSTEPQH